MHVKIPNLNADGTDPKATKFESLSVEVRGTGGEHTTIGEFVMMSQ